MSPDIGLYQSKYAARRLLDRIPGIERLDPNMVSISSLIPSALASLSIALGWWPLVVVGIAGRMILTTLDGLIAEGHGKKTRVGGYLNRVPAEIGDVFILLGLLAQADPSWVAAVIGGAWLVNVLGVLPLVAGGSGQSVGPAGQTDRLAIIAVVSVIATFAPVEWTFVCQVLVVLLVPTIALRFVRTVRELRAEPGPPQ